MWTIGELKRRARGVFLGNYWRYVLVSVLAGALLAGETSSPAQGKAAEGQSIEDIFASFSPEQAIAAFGIISTAAIIAIVIALLVEIFLRNPLLVGSYKFMIKSARGEKATFSDVGSAFTDGHFGTTFLTMFLQDLYLILWTCLFIVPGIIKLYSYRMVPFIIADNPGMPAKEVITKSREMMNGHKWHAFCLDLSFIGWDILSTITLGLVALFYSDPYKKATDAELYEVLK